MIEKERKKNSRENFFIVAYRNKLLQRSNINKHRPVRKVKGRSLGEYERSFCEES